jgi:UDP-N-acetylmuramate dehydrogenase
MNPLPLFKQNKLLSELTTFGIGGPARYYCEVVTTEDLVAVIAYCYKEKLPYQILGKGSNSLFSDQGFDGLIIHNKIAFCHFEKDKVHVGAGYSFSLLGIQTAKKGFSGLEFASGIPASVGGAVYMNAGASGSDTAACLHSVIYIDEIGEKREYKKEELSFSYRHSSFQKKKGSIASATFLLALEDNSRTRQKEIITYRMSTQPYKEMSAGCVFRNPQNFAAAKLIQECGLKGYRVGDAEVSTMHANFIVNRGNARAQDVLELARLIQKQVEEEKGVKLELEIRSIPYTS